MIPPPIRRCMFLAIVADGKPNRCALGLPDGYLKFFGSDPILVTI
jgi:hypothetical protein